MHFFTAMPGWQIIPPQRACPTWLEWQKGCSVWLELAVLFFLTSALSSKKAQMLLASHPAAISWGRAKGSADRFSLPPSMLICPLGWRPQPVRARISSNCLLKLMRLLRWPGWMVLEGWELWSKLASDKSGSHNFSISISSLCNENDGTRVLYLWQHFYSSLHIYSGHILTYKLFNNNVETTVMVMMTLMKSDSFLQVDYSVIASQAGATLNNLMSHAQELVAKLRSLQFDLREFVCLKFLVLFSLGRYSYSFIITSMKITAHFIVPVSTYKKTHMVQEQFLVRPINWSGIGRS